MIVVVGPGPARRELGEARACGPRRAARCGCRVKVSRAPDLSGPATVEVVMPEHWKGVTAAPVTIPAGRAAGELVLRFATDAGPFNMPLTVRDDRRPSATPVVAEARNWRS